MTISWNKYFEFINHFIFWILWNLQESSEDRHLSINTNAQNWSSATVILRCYLLEECGNNLKMCRTVTLCVYMCVCRNLWMCVFVCVYLISCTCVLVCASAHMCSYEFVGACVCIYSCIHTYTYTYIYVYLLSLCVCMWVWESERENVGLMGKLWEGSGKSQGTQSPPLQPNLKEKECKIVLQGEYWSVDPHQVGRHNSTRAVSATSMLPGLLLTSTSATCM